MCELPCGGDGDGVEENRIMQIAKCKIKRNSGQSLVGCVLTHHLKDIRAKGVKEADIENLMTFK